MLMVLVFSDLFVLTYAGGLFMSPGGVAFSIIDVVTVYGGLLLFSGFLLYDCQKIFHKAELSSTYDPVNE